MIGHFGGPLHTSLLGAANICLVRLLNVCLCLYIYEYITYAVYMYAGTHPSQPVATMIEEQEHARPTCEESKRRLGLRPHDFDLSEEGERGSVRGPGERLHVPGVPRLADPELGAGEGQHGEVRRAQLPVHLLQGAVLLVLSLLATRSRHVDNQRRLQEPKRGHRRVTHGVHRPHHHHPPWLCDPPLHHSCKNSRRVYWKRCRRLPLTLPRYLSKETVLPRASFTSNA